MPTFIYHLFYLLDNAHLTLIQSPQVLNLVLRSDWYGLCHQLPSWFPHHHARHSTNGNCWHDHSQIDTRLTLQGCGRNATLTQIDVEHQDEEQLVWVSLNGPLNINQ